MNRNYSFIKRLFSSQKSIKAELNFKEGNILPNPFDVIDKNVAGVENRLRLYELRRLKDQLVLDASELNFIKNDNLSECKKYENKKVTHSLRYRSISEFPGTTGGSEHSINPSVTLSILPESLNLSEKDLEKFCKVFKVERNSEFNFHISNFPFVSQNKSRAQKLLAYAIESIKCDDSKAFNENDTIVPISNSNHSSKEEYEFPSQWLQKKLV